MGTYDPIAHATRLRLMATALMDDAIVLERLADELDADTVKNSTGVEIEDPNDAAMVVAAGLDATSAMATVTVRTTVEETAGRDFIGEAITEAVRTGEPVLVSHDPSIGPCPKRDERPHDFQPMRERDGIYIEKCVSCNMNRWVQVDAPHPRRFNYGPPPPPPRARIMGPDEELAPGEEFERTDTDVPRIISTPQPVGKRMVNGRVLEYEE